MVGGRERPKGNKGWWRIRRLWWLKVEEWWKSDEVGVKKEVKKYMKMEKNIVLKEEVSIVGKSLMSCSISHTLIYFVQEFLL